MKKNILAIILTSFFFVLSFVLTAQTDSPPDPGGDPEGGEAPPIGGGAPIGGGTLILVALGAAYGGKKAYQVIKDNQE